MPEFRELFAQNRNWARKITRTDPEFFAKISKRQTPEYLWIGCSDSRVPANAIVDMMPGDMFVHRNIANLVVHTDLNGLAVIQYAVEILRVKHIIICGHYGCGGVRTAMEETEHGLIDNWLRSVRHLYQHHRAELDPLPTLEARIDRLCELNVSAQVSRLAETTVLQHAWKSGQSVSVHGWIYNLADGILRDLKVSAHLPDEPAP